jgi:hypothetical protein
VIDWLAGTKRNDSGIVYLLFTFVAVMSAVAGFYEKYNVIRDRSLEQVNR